MLEQHPSAHDAHYLSSRQAADVFISMPHRLWRHQLSSKPLKAGGLYQQSGIYCECRLGYNSALLSQSPVRQGADKKSLPGMGAYKQGPLAQANATTIANYQSCYA
jgi:hypothetical protein